MVVRRLEASEAEGPGRERLHTLHVLHALLRVLEPLPESVVRHRLM